MKVVEVNEWTPKQFLNPTMSPKIAQVPKKVQNKPKIKSRSTARIEGNKENKTCCTI